MRAAALLAAPLALAPAAVAQKYGGGLGKTTYSVSDADGCYQWMMTFLPVTMDHPNGDKACGQVGRVRLATEAMPSGMCYLKYGATGTKPPQQDGSNGKVPTAAVFPAAGGGCDVTVGRDVAAPAGAGGSSAAAATVGDCCAACAADAQCDGAAYVPGMSQVPFSQGFGLHAVHVNASSLRPHGNLSNGDVERALDAKLAAVYAGGAYDAFLDFTSGHWVASLDPYVAQLSAAKWPFAALSWADDVNGGAYYSIIVRVHTSMILIELMSGACSACAGALPVPTARYFFGRGRGPADVFGNLSDGGAARPLMHAARVSWPTSSLDATRRFFVDGLGLKVVRQAAAGGAKTDVYDFTPVDSIATMQFHHVERPASATTGALSVADFERGMTGCHDAALRTDTCGFDQWLDNHIGVSFRQSPLDIGKLQRVLVAHGLRYRVLKSAGGGHVCYAAAPGGLAVSYNGLDDGDFVPTTPIGTDGSLGLCGIGNATYCSPASHRRRR